MILAIFAAAAVAAGFHRLDEPKIASELAAIHAAHPGLEARIAAVSERFLGTPYKLGPLGEGETGEFDRDPLVTFAQADCTTFVEQVMALALEPELEKAKALLQRIRYRDGKVSYETRNHFPETDWIPNNMEAGFLSDVTVKVADRKVQWVFKTIRKREWYVAKSTADLEGFSDEPEAQRVARVERWRERGREINDVVARLPYVPLEHLAELGPAIPSGAVGSVIRADLPDRPVVVTHQVLVLQTPGGPIVRHAAYGKQVQDEPLDAYFAKFKDAKWRVLGLNLTTIGGLKTP
ncbi:MAG: DUF1460 domain-containing protein [Elusimicrobia bacterium]|nr:DUF1460 domain-containing protein [Elusimicrobiota bacterium]